MPQNYSKPPILEADLHVRYESMLSAGEQKRIPNLLKSAFPSASEERDYQLQFQMKDGVPIGVPTPREIDTGFRLLSGDGLKIVVVRGGSVLFSHHAPYPGWDSFISEARFLFDTLRSKVGVKKIKSVGLRYVNRLDIPLRAENPAIVPSDYLVIGVSLPSTGLEKTMNTFQMTAEVALNHDQLVARVTTATAVPELIDHAAMLFDIDIIAEHNIPQREDEFWALVYRMREAKNRIFESGVTNKSRELFGWKP